MVVQAILRRDYLEAIPAYIRRSGDPDAGTILLKLAISRDSAIILDQARDADGRAGWLRVGGDQPLSEQDAEAAIEKAIPRDPDLYVIEIEDSKHRLLVHGLRL